MIKLLLHILSIIFNVKIRRTMEQKKGFWPQGLIISYNNHEFPEPVDMQGFIQEFTEFSIEQDYDDDDYLECTFDTPEEANEAQMVSSDQDGNPEETPNGLIFTPRPHKPF